MKINLKNWVNTPDLRGDLDLIVEAFEKRALLAEHLEKESAIKASLDSAVKKASPVFAEYKKARDEYSNALSEYHNKKEEYQKLEAARAEAERKWERRETMRGAGESQGLVNPETIEVPEEPIFDKEPLSSALASKMLQAKDSVSEVFEALAAVASWEKELDCLRKRLAEISEQLPLAISVSSKMEDRLAESEARTRLFFESKLAQERARLKSAKHAVKSLTESIEKMEGKLPE